MKKLILLFFLLSIFFLFPHHKESPVFLEMDYVQNTVLCIQVENINTKNVLSKIGNLKIFSIEPYINPLYKSKLINLNRYDFYAEINENNIYKFTKNYLQILKQNGYQKDYYNFMLNGIKIEKIYMEKEEFMQNFNHKIKYTIC